MNGFDSTPMGDVVEHDDVILGYKDYLILYRPKTRPYGAEIINRKLHLKGHVTGSCALEVLGKAYQRIEDEINQSSTEID